jgi:hypothetical protein
LEHNIKLASCNHTYSYEKYASRFYIRAKEGTVPLPFSVNRAEKRSHNLGKPLGEGLEGLSKNNHFLDTLIKAGKTTCKAFTLSMYF